MARASCSRNSGSSAIVEDNDIDGSISAATPVTTRSSATIASGRRRSGGSRRTRIGDPAHGFRAPPSWKATRSIDSQYGIDVTGFGGDATDQRQHHPRQQHRGNRRRQRHSPDHRRQHHREERDGHRGARGPRRPRHDRQHALRQRDRPDGPGRLRADARRQHGLPDLGRRQPRPGRAAGRGRSRDQLVGQANPPYHIESATALTTGTHICRTRAPGDRVATYARGRVSPDYAEW